MPSLRSLLLACCLLGSTSVFAADALLNPVIRVGTAADYPPLTSQVGGQVVGIEADLAAAISQRSGHRLEFKVLPWSSLIMALQQGDIDVIMSGMSITPERAAQVAFSAPYFSVGQMAIIRVADLGRFSSPVQILQPKVRVGYVADTTGAAYVKKFAGMTSLRAFASVEPALDALLQGEIDCVVHDSVTTWMIDKERRYSSLISLRNPLTSEALAWAVSKEQPALLQMLDSNLAALRADGSLERIESKWLPVRATVEKAN
ncbi:substrate-binding periplasmic protein [Pseudomonas sp. N040]|uniref:substrate-binding periplasmic protein n=1 Tax=Pseudomonas sp. N040 TaxID=2785325 RepID=UPI0018A2B6F0|nr:ABC transporter substrate-binding protein [Pseudomonas sp. N040]MBF7729214.1 amino acid ABC transporter substrate-binding protein [Pseudomonas sp. N040]MBW7012854.1 ABC transporter substrate-binding protein [Pseudomonas sp. N040]